MKTVVSGTEWPAALTRREKEVLHWIAQGKSNWEAGRILDCSQETVKKHLYSIYRKLNVENRTSAAATYLRVKARGKEGRAKAIGR